MSVHKVVILPYDQYASLQANKAEEVGTKKSDDGPPPQPPPPSIGDHSAKEVHPSSKTGASVTDGGSPPRLRPLPPSMTPPSAAPPPPPTYELPSNEPIIDSSSKGTKKKEPGHRVNKKATKKSLIQRGTTLHKVTEASTKDSVKRKIKMSPSLFIKKFWLD